MHTQHRAGLVRIKTMKDLGYLGPFILLRPEILQVFLEISFVYLSVQSADILY